MRILQYVSMNLFKEASLANKLRIAFPDIGLLCPVKVRVIRQNIRHKLKIVIHLFVSSSVPIQSCVKTEPEFSASAAF